jgi:hypothetical protein
LKSEGRKDRSIQYIEHCKGNRRWVSLRSKAYKYNFYYGGSYEELFDMDSDPQETTNLLYGSPSAEHLSVSGKMRKTLAGIEALQGLEGGIQKNGEFIQMEPYIAKPYRETNFPLYPDQLTKQAEIEEQNTMEDEILSAVEKEPVVRLEDLDLETFKTKSGLRDPQIDKMLNRQRHKA